MDSRHLCTDVSLGLWEGPDRCVKTCRSSHRLGPSDQDCSHLNWFQCTQCRVGLLKCASTPYLVPDVVQLVPLSICLLLIRLSIHPFTPSIFRLEQDPDRHYFLLGIPSKEVRILTEEGFAAHATFGAATSIRVSSSPLSRRFLEAQFDAFKAIDDVWNEYFV